MSARPKTPPPDQPFRVINRHQPGFCMIYYEILDVFGADLKAEGIAVYVALMRFANAEGTCYPSLSKIAEKAQVSKSTVQRVLRTLERLGLLHKEDPGPGPDGGDRPRIYYMLDVKVAAQEYLGCQQVDTGQVVCETTPPSPTDHPPVVTQTTLHSLPDHLSRISVEQESYKQKTNHHQPQRSENFDPRIKGTDDDDRGDKSPQSEQTQPSAEKQHSLIACMGTAEEWATLNEAYGADQVKAMRDYCLKYAKEKRKPIHNLACYVKTALVRQQSAAAAPAAGGQADGHNQQTSKPKTRVLRAAPDATPSNPYGYDRPGSMAARERAWMEKVEQARRRHQEAEQERVERGDLTEEERAEQAEARKAMSPP